MFVCFDVVFRSRNERGNDDRRRNRRMNFLNDDGSDEGEWIPISTSSSMDDDFGGFRDNDDDDVDLDDDNEDDAADDDNSGGGNDNDSDNMMWVTDSDNDD